MCTVEDATLGGPVKPDEGVVTPADTTFKNRMIASSINIFAAPDHQMHRHGIEQFIG